MAKNIQVALVLDNSKFNKSINQSEKQVDKFSKNSTAGIGRIGAALAALGGVAAIKGIVATGAAFQDLQNSLNVVFGGVEEGAAAFDRVNQFAASTQFSVQTLTGAFIQLQGAGIEPTDRLLQTFADTASVSTDGAGFLTAALDLLTRTTQGGLGLMDIQRLEDRGVPAFRLIAEETGIARKEVSKFGKTAAGAKTITDGLIAGLNRKFGGALATQVGLINFELNQLGDATDKFQKALFDTFADDAAVGIQGLTAAINKLAENMDGLLQIGKGLAQLITVILLFIPAAKALKAASFAMTKLKGSASLLAASGPKLTSFFKNTGSSIYKGITEPVRTASKAISRLMQRNGAWVQSTSIATKKVSTVWKGDVLSPIGRTKLAFMKAGEGLLWLGGAVLGFQSLRNVMDGAATVADGLAEKMGPPKELFKADQARILKEITDQYNELTDGDTLFDMEAQLPIDMLEEFAKMIDRSNGSLPAYNSLMESFNKLFADPKTIEEMEERKKALDDLNNSYAHLFEPVKKLEEAIADGIVDRTEYNALQFEINRLQELGILSAEDAAQKQRELDEAFGENAGLQRFIDTMNSATDTLANDLATALQQGEGAMDSFKSFFKTMVQQVIADAVKLLYIIPLLQAIGFTTIGGSITGLAGAGASFGQTGAGGGNLMKNRPVLVGESGPEIFYPASSGNLQANGMGTTVNYNIQATDAVSFQALVARDPEFIYSVTEAGRRRIPGSRI